MAALVALSSACSPGVGNDVRRVATHAEIDYTWRASSCRSAGGIFGHECEDELVTIDSVEVGDERLVEVSEVSDAGLRLHTGGPGETLVVLLGGDDDVMHLDVEVVEPTVELADPWAQTDVHLMLPGASDRFAYRLVDDGGSQLRGVSDDVEIAAQGMAGVVVEPVEDHNAVLVYVPDKVGDFVLAPMTRGQVLPVTVVDAAAIDGVELGGYDVAAQVREVVPTVDGVPVRAGELAYTISAADPDAACTVTAPGWGRMDLIGAAGGPAMPIWGVQVTDGPCDLRVQLPDAAGGEGLDLVVEWTE